MYLTCHFLNLSFILGCSLTLLSPYYLISICLRSNCLDQELYSLLTVSIISFRGNLVSSVFLSVSV